MSQISLFVYLNAVHFSALLLLCGALVSTRWCCPKWAVLHLLEVTAFVLTTTSPLSSRRAGQLWEKNPDYKLENIYLLLIDRDIEHDCTQFQIKNSNYNYFECFE